MKSMMNIGPAVTAALLAAAAALPAQVPRTLTFCAGMGNLPMSQEGQVPGFEVEFARSLAERLGAEARFEWLEPHTDSFEQAVLEGRCDAALGAIVDPGPMAGDRTIAGVALTEPYYGAGYLLIQRVGTRSVRSLPELGDARIGVEMESIPIFTLRQRGHNMYALRDYEAVIEAVAERRVDYGYLWGPLAAWLLRDRTDVVASEGFEPVERWNFALAVREEEEELLRHLNAAIRELARSKEIARIFASYGVPYLPPI